MLICFKRYTLEINCKLNNSDLHFILREIFVYFSRPLKVVKIEVCHKKIHQNIVNLLTSTLLAEKYVLLVRTKFSP